MDGIFTSNMTLKVVELANVTCEQANVTVELTNETCDHTNVTWNRTHLTEIRLPISSTSILLNMTLASLGGFALVFNSLIMFVLVKYAGGLGEVRINAQFIAITINDIIGSAIVLFSSFYSLPMFHYNRHLCASIFLGYFIAMASTVIILAVIGVHRFVRVLTITKKQINLTDRSATCMISAVPVTWLIACLLNIGLYLATVEKGDVFIPECSPTAVFGEKKFQFIVTAMLTILFSTLAVNCLYGIVCIKLRKALRQTSGIKLSCCTCFSKNDHDASDGQHNDGIDSSPQRLSIEPDAHVSSDYSSGHSQNSTSTKSSFESQNISASQQTSLQSPVNSSSKPVPNKTSGPPDAIQRSTSADSANDSISTSTSIVTASVSEAYLKKPVSAAEINRSKRSIRALVTVILLLVVLNVSVLPSVCLWIASNILERTPDTNIIITVIACESVLNALLNPCVYCLRMEKIRTSLKHLFMRRQLR